MRPFNEITIKGRPLKPFSFALMLSMFGSAWYFILFIDTLDHIPLLIGLVSAVAGTLLFAGWWWRHINIHLWGLLLSAGAWTSMTICLFSVDQEYLPAWSALCWLIAIIGAWAIEREEHEEPL
jgi:hypothetical protein